LTKKTIRGKPYYYARECKRIDGKPKIVWQQYLGKAEDIVTAMTQGQGVAEPEHALVSDFGAVAALYDLAQRLKLAEHIDAHVPKRGRGPSVGTYLLVAIINRCVAPCSKAGIGEWFQNTALRRLIGIEARQLSSQRFWDNMDRVSSGAIQAIERDVVSAMVRSFKVDLKQVLFDGTNFFTFIDTFNERNNLAQRGKSKEGRKALRIVGLALLVSADGHIPLLHRTYPGNQADAPTFRSLTDALIERYRELTEGAEHVTLVFDKGNNAKDNLHSIDQSPYHFIGSLVPTQHPKLLAIPSKRFHSLESEGLPEVSVYRSTREVFGVERTVLVTYNENLFIAQSRTLLREIAKRQSNLRELQQQLRRWHRGEVRGGQAPTVTGVTRKVEGWLKARHMKELFDVTVEEHDGLAWMTYRFNHQAWTRLQRTLLGKTLLFTDNDDWSDAEIVRGYRAQHHVENGFRCMKDSHHICLRPQHHWTDQKIEVHVFCCVLALMLCSLLRRELQHQGIDLSIPALLEELEKIREVGVVFPPQDQRRSPTIKMTLSKLSEQQQKLYDTLDLKRHRAT
ncbi:MAG: IS1634 family transposase, partial [Wenzhouxiangella sp.]